MAEKEKLKIKFHQDNTNKTQRIKVETFNCSDLQSNVDVIL